LAIGRESVHTDDGFRFRFMAYELDAAARVVGRFDTDPPAECEDMMVEADHALTATHAFVALSCWQFQEGPDPMKGKPTFYVGATSRARAATP
jgi:hypothetical protein